MPYAADLHLHSRYASGVSPEMTVETIALFARRKGVDVIGTGDCLHSQWLSELEARLVPAEPGWFALAPEVDARVKRQLPPALQRRLRFVLTTEVCCAPPGTPRLGGIHHLLYFPSFAEAHAFQRRIAPHGDLTEGRPSLSLTSRQLLELVLEHGGDCRMAPAHVMNPYFSSLGSQERHRTLEEIFDDLAPHLFAAETGLTATPPMCRRIASLDRHALFSCSDAHSPENIGRECTLLETEAGYAPMLDAIGRGDILGTLKFPILRTRYFLNRCGVCAESFEGTTCPRCGGRLAMGSRDWLEKIATRAEPAMPADAPPFRMLLPLKYVIGELCGLGRETKAVAKIADQLLASVGPERFILAEADFDTLSRAATPQLARAIVAQREVAAGALVKNPAPSTTSDSQLSLL